MSAAQGVADIATIAIIQHQVTVDAQILNLQLSQALNSRIMIEQAKGQMSQAANIDMDRAFQHLRNHARNVVEWGRRGVVNSLERRPRRKPPVSDPTTNSTTAMINSQKRP